VLLWTRHNLNWDETNSNLGLSSSSDSGIGSLWVRGPRTRNRFTARPLGCRTGRENKARCRIWLLSQWLGNLLKRLQTCWTLDLILCRFKGHECCYNDSIYVISGLIFKTCLASELKVPCMSVYSAGIYAIRCTILGDVKERTHCIHMAWTRQAQWSEFYMYDIRCESEDMLLSQPSVQDMEDQDLNLNVWHRYSKSPRTSPQDCHHINYPLHLSTSHLCDRGRTIGSHVVGGTFEVGRNCDVMCQARPISTPQPDLACPEFPET
jgi:hypothetical protein